MDAGRSLHDPLMRGVKPGDMGIGRCLKGGRYRTFRRGAHPFRASAKDSRITIYEGSDQAEDRTLHELRAWASSEDMASSYSVSSLQPRLFG